MEIEFRVNCFGERVKGWPTADFNIRTFVETTLATPPSFGTSVFGMQQTLVSLLFACVVQKKQQFQSV